MTGASQSDSSQSRNELADDLEKQLDPVRAKYCDWSEVPQIKVTLPASRWAQIVSALRAIPSAEVASEPLDQVARDEVARIYELAKRDDWHMQIVGSDIRVLCRMALQGARSATACSPNEAQMDSVRGVLQILRGKPGCTFADVRQHCELRGDDLAKWPEWLRTEQGYVTERAAAVMIYEIMRSAESRKA